MTSESQHISVLIEEVCRDLAWSEATTRVADLTLGAGGHLEALLLRNPRPAKVIALDQDPSALASAKARLTASVENAQEFIQFEHSNFSALTPEAFGQFDRILVDLGVSSMQLDQAERGFSFQKSGPLDMRMNPSEGIATAKQFLMQCDEHELARVFRDYSEEPSAWRFANRIVDRRSSEPFETTEDLVKLLGFQLDSRDRQGRHPLTRVFQALRIAVNAEIDSLEALLSALPLLLRKNGRVGIISFHSLEDRAVKWSLKGKLKSLHKKVVVASEEETAQNPRSRSAKWRVFCKVDDGL